MKYYRMVNAPPGLDACYRRLADDGCLLQQITHRTFQILCGPCWRTLQDTYPFSPNVLSVGHPFVQFAFEWEDV